ncbi:FAD-binding domain-containing protein [Hypoxylon fragiforme]|uniref:FAD-binding domain-containing protein n=1 Tax=Hypoxylon fragiforme TaxID=63214 RepID=UPI0020C68625|nr:FAD-binding domain-containing protein [Hypoxylon fragiforme]KAI2612390.1 FAD-binding domain-containing protein [Hypoxylon fragiforme]
MDSHKEAVISISKRLEQFYAQRQPFRVYHGTTNSTRTSDKSRSNTVDTSNLNHVLSIDQTKKTALVEPNVPMDQLVAAALQNSLVPLVVMEFPGITVGGGFSGMAGESSSCRHGPFDSTVNWIEIVLASGETLRASKTERPDLFWGAASAFGTLGVVTLLEVQLRDAKDLVELTHYPASSFAAASQKIQEEIADPAVEYVDAVAFSAQSFVICSGRLVDAVPDAKPRRYLRRQDPWFYLDVQKVAQKAKAKAKAEQKAVVHYIPLTDYLFRWDRGGFWVARYAFRYFLTPFNRATRLLLDRFMRARVMYHALHASGLSSTYIIQDVGIPFPHSPAFHHFLDANLPTYPLWLCPVRARRDDPDSAHGLHAHFSSSHNNNNPDADPHPEFLLNFGIWGPAPPSRDPADLVRLNRSIEHRAHALGGTKTLYAQAFYTEAEFWATYDRGAYDAVRAAYGASHLPSVYDKVKVKIDDDDGEVSRMPAALRRVRPFQGLYGVYKAWRGGEYLLRERGERKEKGEGKGQPAANKDTTVESATNGS